MPITFAQPDPMAPAVTAGAAAAEFAAKTFPTIASIYENAARLRASAGGGGGGHGGVVQGGGPIQVLPSGDGGAGLYQTEAQANREQRALDLGFEAQQDPVSRHIVLQSQLHQEAADRAQQQQQQQFMMMNPDLFPRGGARRGPAIQAEPAPTMWGADDEADLAGKMQAIDGVRTKFNNGIINSDTYYKLMEPLQQQRSQLLAKQQKAEEDKTQMQNRKEMRASLHQTALMVAQGRGLMAHAPSAPSDIPGMIPDRNLPDGRGGWKNVNEGKQLEMLKAWHAAQKQQTDIEAKDRTERDSAADYTKIRAQAVKELSNVNSATVPTEEAIRERITKIREHREELRTGKKATPAAGAGDERARYDELRKTLFQAQPAQTVPAATVTPSEPPDVNSYGMQGSY